MSAQDSGALMKVLAGILEDAVRALQRIEKKIGDQQKIFDEFTQKIEKIERSISDSVTILAQKEIPNLERTLTQKISELGIQNMDQIDSSLDQIITKLQKSIQILSIQNLVSRIESLATIRIGAPKATKKEIQPQEREKEKATTTEATKSSTIKTETLPPPPVATEKKEDKKKKESDESLIKPSSFFGS